MGIIDVVLVFIFSSFIAFLVTAGFMDCAGDCFITRLIAFFSFGGAFVILIASIILMFI